MQFKFAKYEGLGNDFIVAESTLAFTSEQIAALCNRHFGVGADGVLLVETHQPRMKVLNADGSVPEMCGNGLRCVALYLAQQHRQTSPFVVMTDAGPHLCEVLTHDNRTAQVRVVMRPPTWPADGNIQTIDVEGMRIEYFPVSMGNPHAVIFERPDLDPNVWGPRVQNHSAFAGNVNVGFARRLSSERIELSVWERGAGLTMACGTGACAAVVAGVITSRLAANVPVLVKLGGGELTIDFVPSEPRLTMTGPASHVFDGATEVSE